jgi:hypothetical protein
MVTATLMMLRAILIDGSGMTFTLVLWSRSLLQRISSPCGPYSALGKRASAREGNGSGGQTKSAPARPYGCVWSLQRSKMILFQLPSYAFGTYKALGKRACARAGICSGELWGRMTKNEVNFVRTPIGRVL